MYAEQCEGESAVNLSDSTRKGIIKWSPGRFFFFASFLAHHLLSRLVVMVHFTTVTRFWVSSIKRNFQKNKWLKNHSSLARVDSIRV